MTTANGPILNALTQLGGSVAPILLDASLKGLAVLVLAGLATLAMRRAAAATRHLIWFLGIASGPVPA